MILVLLLIKLNNSSSLRWSAGQPEGVTYTEVQYLVELPTSSLAQERKLSLILTNIPCSSQIPLLSPAAECCPHLSFPYLGSILSSCMTGPETLLKFLNYFLNREIPVSLQSVLSNDEIRISKPRESWLSDS